MWRERPFYRFFVTRKPNPVHGRALGEGDWVGPQVIDITISTDVGLQINQANGQSAYALEIRNFDASLAIGFMGNVDGAGCIFGGGSAHDLLIAATGASLILGFDGTTQTNKIVIGCRMEARNQTADADPGDFHLTVKAGSVHPSTSFPSVGSSVQFEGGDGDGSLPGNGGDVRFSGGIGSVASGNVLLCSPRGRLSVGTALMAGDPQGYVQADGTPNLYADTTKLVADNAVELIDGSGNLIGYIPVFKAWFDS